MIADEARTFGMEGLFRQVGIYNPHGQNYVPSDRDLVVTIVKQKMVKYYKKVSMN